MSNVANKKTSMAPAAHKSKFQKLQISNDRKFENDPIKSTVKKTKIQKSNQNVADWLMTTKEKSNKLVAK